MSSNKINRFNKHRCFICRSDENLKSISSQKFICELCDSAESRAQVAGYLYRTTNLHKHISITEGQNKKERKGPSYLKRNVL